MATWLDVIPKDTIPPRTGLSEFELYHFVDRLRSWNEMESKERRAWKRVQLSSHV